MTREPTRSVRILDTVGHTGIQNVGHSLVALSLVGGRVRKHVVVLVCNVGEGILELQIGGIFHVTWRESGFHVDISNLLPVIISSAVALVTVGVELVLFVRDQLSSEPQRSLVSSHRVDDVLVTQVSLGWVLLPSNLFWSQLNIGVV